MLLYIDTPVSKHLKKIWILVNTFILLCNVKYTNLNFETTFSQMKAVSQNDFLTFPFSFKAEERNRKTYLKKSKILDLLVSS